MGATAYRERTREFLHVRHRSTVGVLVVDKARPAAEALTDETLESSFATGRVIRTRMLAAFISTKTYFAVSLFAST